MFRKMFSIGRPPWRFSSDWRKTILKSISGVKYFSSNLLALSFLVNPVPCGAGFEDEKI
jgi:hypothetical protein